MPAKSNAELHSEAIYAVLLTTLRLLHERGILPLQDVVSRVESQQYSFVAGHDFEPNFYLQALTDQLQQLADAYAQSSGQSGEPTAT